MFKNVLKLLEIYKKLVDIFDTITGGGVHKSFIRLEETFLVKHEKYYKNAKLGVFRA